MRKKTNDHGFTLLEMVAVLAIIGILATIALPNYQDSVRRAREAVLLHDLYYMRDAIDEYLLDKGAYPKSLNDLVKDKYLRAIPTDPMTEKKNWRVVFEQYDEFDEPDFEPGIYDVKSRSRERSRKGTRYSSW